MFMHREMVAFILLILTMFAGFMALKKLHYFDPHQPITSAYQSVSGVHQAADQDPPSTTDPTSKSEVDPYIFENVVFKDIDQFMAENYGKYLPALKAWSGGKLQFFGKGSNAQETQSSAGIGTKDVPAAEDNEATEDQPQSTICVQNNVLINNQQHLLLAICTDYPNSAHAGGGQVDMFLFARSEKGLKTIASFVGQEGGEFGNTQSPSIIKIGREAYAVEIPNGSTGSGVTTSLVQWFLPHGNTFAEIMGMTTSLSDQGSCTEENARAEDNTSTEDSVPAKDSAPAEDSTQATNPDSQSEGCSTELAGDYHIDENHPDLDFYPLSVMQSGTYVGKKIERAFKVDFDTQHWKYPMTDMELGL